MDNKNQPIMPTLPEKARVPRPEGDIHQPPKNLRQLFERMAYIEDQIKVTRESFMETAQFKRLDLEAPLEGQSQEMLVKYSQAMAPLWGWMDWSFELFEEIFHQ